MRCHAVRNRRGLNLVEVLLAVAVLSVSLGAVAAMLDCSVRSDVLGRRRVAADFLLCDMVERYRLTPPELLEKMFASPRSERWFRSDPLLRGGGITSPASLDAMGLSRRAYLREGEGGLRFLVLEVVVRTPRGGRVLASFSLPLKPGLRR